jgi:low temperature requirement protein LtrA
MIAGIVLFALGVKKVLEHAGDPLSDMPAVALCGGLALYLLAHVAFRVRNIGSVNWERTIAALVCAALVPVATSASGVATLALLTAVLVALIALETVRHAEARARIRQERVGH